MFCQSLGTSLYQGSIVYRRAPLIETPQPSSDQNTYSNERGVTWAVGVKRGLPVCTVVRLDVLRVQLKMKMLKTTKLSTQSCMHTYYSSLVTHNSQGGQQLISLFLALLFHALNICVVNNLWCTL